MRLGTHVGSLKASVARWRLRRAGGFVVEELERRTLLTSVLTIPSRITPSTTPQQLFVAGNDTFNLTTQPGLNVVGSQFYRFALHNAAPAATTFSVQSTAPGVDAALALYDADGNLIQQADSDTPNPSTETLSAPLASGQQFELGVFTANVPPSNILTPAQPVTLTAAIPPQAVSAAIKINPATGQAQLPASSGQSAFSSPTDVDFYPLDFTNGGAAGTVTLQAPVPDTKFFAQLFRQDSATDNWVQIASGSGAPVTLNVTPAGQLDVTNSAYVLAVSPLNFNSPAQPYEVDLSAPTIGPASVTGQQQGTALTLLPASPGTAGASVSQAFSAATLTPFTAVDNGPVTITLQTTTAQPALSVYDSTGANLLGVAASRTAGDQVSVTVQATKGQRFIARAGIGAGAFGGQMTLGVTQTYTPTPLQATSVVQQQSHLAVAPGTGGQLERITPPAGADFLVVELTPDAGATVAPQITAVASGLAAVQQTGTAGKATLLIINLSQASGPVDVFLSSTSGAGTATFSFAAVTIPKQLSIGQLANQTLDVKTGGLAATLPSGGFGQLAGVQFYELSPGQSQTLTAQSSSGAPALLLRYVQSGSVLRLDDRAVVPANGMGTLTSNLQGTLLYAVAGIWLDVSSAGNLQFQVTSPTIPQGIGVAMAPNQVAIPNQPPPVAPFISQLKLNSQILLRPQQRDLFATTLPFNMNASPTLTFTPNTIGGPLAARITVLDANNNTLATFTTTAGQAFTSPAIGAITAANSAGQTVRLLVEPISGSLGDGMYNLELDVGTTDPNPYLATDTSLQPFQFSGPTSLPFGSSVTSSFTSSSPTIQVFQIALPNTTTPFKIWTEDLSPTANTNIKIYRGEFIDITDPLLLTEFTNEPAPSFDYFPANRSQVDSQVTVNNYHILDGQFTGTDPVFHGSYATYANTVFVAVKNEQGSQGQYRIHAEAVNEPLVGPGAPDNELTFGGFNFPTFIDPLSGKAQVVFGSSVSNNDAIQLMTPHGLTTAPITVTFPVPGHVSSTVTLYDSTQTQIYQQTQFAGNPIFTLPQLAPSSLYTMRITSGNTSVSNVNIAAGVSTGTAPNPPADSDTVAPVTTESYSRVVQPPDGNFKVNSGILRGGVLNPVTISKLVIDVPAAGPAHFSAALGGILNSSFALYNEFQQGGEFLSITGPLVDFASQPGLDGTYSFNVYLTPGTYILKLVGTYLAPFHSYSITGSIPGFDAQRITLDPTSAQNDQLNLQTVDSSYQFYNTEMYQVTAPGGVQGPLNVDLHNILNAPSGSGIFDVGVFKQTTTGYTQVGSAVLNLNTSPPASAINLVTTDMPVSGDQYFISVNRDLAGSLVINSPIVMSLGPSFQIPQGSLPDLVVQPILLSPDNGQTKVQITVRNLGYAAAGPSHELLNLSNYPSPSVLSFGGIGPFGTASYITDWIPDDPSNTVTFTADSDNQLTETNKGNNVASVALSTVDTTVPTITIALKNPALTGESPAWGRYFAGVLGLNDDILVTANDSPANLYSVLITGPVFSAYVAPPSTSKYTVDLPIDFGSLKPTSSTNPNTIIYNAVDIYGLHTGQKMQQIDVVPQPQFINMIKWDGKNKRYNFGFGYDVVNLQESLNDLLGLGIPVVGDKQNQFLVHIGATGTATLDPTLPPFETLSAHVLLTALWNTIYDETFDDTVKPTNNLATSFRLGLDPRTLDVDTASISVQLQNLKVLNFQTPKIKIFSLGIPDVASVDGSLKFGIGATLSAGVKLGIDPTITQDPLTAPDRLGVMSPTFIQPGVNASATAEGDVEVAGFDVASLSGTVTLGLSLTAGLDNNNPNKVFSFSDFFNHLAYQLSANVAVHLKAHVAIIGDIWKYDYSHNFPITGNTTQGIITKDGSGGGSIAQILSNPLSVLGSGLQSATVPSGVFASGNDPVGAYPIDPHPQLVIDPATGNALAIQVVNASQASGVSVGNLQVSTRNGGAWSTPAILPSGDVADPHLALSHDNASTLASAVVYEADNAAGNPSTQTLSQKLAATDIRYRYFNGASFGPEQSITNDSLLDQDPSLAFNSAGKGLVAWIHNTAAVPMDSTGNFSRNTQDIEAAVWNPLTHAFSAPIAITSPDGVADYNPAAYVDDAGKMYVVWLRGTDTSNVVMYSTSTGGAWSTPAALPITGLTAGGSFNELALGRDKLGRINVIFSYRNPAAADGSVQVFLLDRSTDPTTFANPTGVEQIAAGANYSAVQTTSEADGSLVAYWQQADGVNNGVFYSVLNRSSASPSAPWSVPTTLTSTTDLTMYPSLAIDTNGHMDVLFDQRTPEGGTAASPSQAPPVGVTLAAGVGSSNLAQLPELSFSTPLFFQNATALTAGSSAVGQATIFNSGLATAQVTVNSFVGLPGTGTQIDTRQITLSPGNTYSYSQLFPISAGQQTYSVQVISATGEAITTSDDVSSVTLAGLPNITVNSLTTVTQSPQPGQQITLVADIANTSTSPIGGFDVTLYQGDPLFPQLGGGPLSTIHVASLPASGDVKINFPVNLPTSAGAYVYTVLADSGHGISESNESDNTGQYVVSFLTDPAITSVSAVANNMSGSKNVTVTVNLSNNGNISLTNLPIHLQLSRDGSPFVEVAQQPISLNPGQAGQLIFQADGLAGDNIYRAMIDSSANAFDTNVSNNSGQAELVIRGLAELSVGPVSFSNVRPQAGDPLLVTATIINSGIADANNVLVELFAVPQTGIPVTLASTRLSKVPALGQVLTTLTADTSQLPPGGYTLMVQVNRLGDVLEASALNDTSNAPFSVVAPLTPSNTINAFAGTANTITIRRDPNGTEDDIWINSLESNAPTQIASISQPLTITGGGMLDTLVLDSTYGNQFSSLIHLSGSFLVNGIQTLAGTTWEIGRSTVFINYAGSADPLTLIRQALQTGYNNGDWNGVATATAGAITTSAGSTLFGIGYADAADGTGINTTPSTIELKYTVIGDTNLDGTVNLVDFLAESRNFAKPASWDTGDVNYDGTTNSSDLLTVTRNFGKTVPLTATISSAPGRQPTLPTTTAPPDAPARTTARRSRSLAKSVVG